MSHVPNFPKFENDIDSTRLSPHSLTLEYDYLLESWKLLDSFEFYLIPIDNWTTPSIEVEWNPPIKIHISNEIPVNNEMIPNGENRNEGIKLDGEKTQDAEVVKGEPEDTSQTIKESSEDESTEEESKQASKKGLQLGSVLLNKVNMQRRRK